MDTVTYEIILKNKGGEGSGIGGGPSASEEELGFLGDAYTQFSAIKSFAPVAMSAGIAKDIFQWQISLVGRNTGSQSTQDKIDAGMSIAGQIMTVGGALVGGIATANPLLIMGAIAGATHIGIGYAREINQNNYDRNWENISLMLARERAGPNLNRSRNG